MGKLRLFGWFRRGAADEKIATLIKTPVPIFTGHDEALAKRTQQRRDAADRIRTRANMVESGAPVSDVLKLVKR